MIVIKILKIIVAVYYVSIGWIGWLLKLLPGGELFKYVYAILALEFASATKCYHLAW